MHCSFETFVLSLFIAGLLVIQIIESVDEEQYFDKFDYRNDNSNLHQPQVPPSSRSAVKLSPPNSPSDAGRPFEPRAPPPPVPAFDETPPSKWRWCYICSGKFPDRECELYPKQVSRGPGKTNCTKNFCTSYIRYKPKSYLITQNENGKAVTSRPLAPTDFDVTSIARECEESARGNTCLMDGDDMGVTCYSTCTTDFCNDDTRRPGWEHFKKSAISKSGAAGVTVATEPSFGPGEAAEKQNLVPNSQENFVSVAPQNPDAPSGKGRYEYEHPLHPDVAMFAPISVALTTATPNRLVHSDDVQIVTTTFGFHGWNGPIGPGRIGDGGDNFLFGDFGSGNFSNTSTKMAAIPGGEAAAKGKLGANSTAPAFQASRHHVVPVILACVVLFH